MAKHSVKPWHWLAAFSIMSAAQLLPKPRGWKPEVSSQGTGTGE